ncbi:outer membrane beta-barrel protein [Pelagibius sp. 7325]|uniref:outer membrane beta-barrel protein n=1 Tax=Pelagibius sp. 7325 TaxID=3131994 RepID=UPI0030ED77BA
MAEDDAVKVGPFALDAGLSVSQGYSDNVYATRNDKVGDGITVITPEVSLTTGADELLSLELFGSAEIGRYWDETSEDYEDFSFGFDASYRIAPKNMVFGGVSFGRDHEERQSPDDVDGDDPTLYYDTQAYIGSLNRFDDVTLRVGGTYGRIDFSDIDAAGGEINNDDRDRDLYTAGLRAGYIVSPGYEVFTQGVFDLRDYDTARDDAGFDRDSDGFSAAFGLRYRPGPMLDVEGFFGLLGQYYDDPALESVTAPDFGFSLEWRPRGTTTVEAFVSRTVQETTLLGASGYLSTGLGASLTQQLRRDLSIDASFSYYQAEYEGVSRDDNTLQAGLGGRYHVTPNIFLDTSYDFVQRDSSDPDEDYDEHRVFFTLGAELVPAYDPDAPDSGPDLVADLGGLYFGLQGSFPNVGTELEGPRGGGGSQTADFSDRGFGGGLFAGYALRAGDWQFGLEVDAEFSEAHWEHTNAPDGRVFSVQKDGSLSAGPVIGYWLNDYSMIYGRFGVVETYFDTNYSEGGDSYDDSDAITGLRIGLGAETAVVDDFFLRLDYSYTSYKDYDITYPGGRDNFANNESMVRLGIGYRFPSGAKNEKLEPEPEPDVGGFYVGLGAGHGALHSHQGGPRQAGAFTNADSGDEGASGGVFAGYGAVWRRIYLGGEVEGEVSDVTWNRERQPTGRIFKIEKKAGLGAALRAGYVLPGGALAYARAGVIASQFSTSVATTGTSAQEDEILLGARFGGGLELPISESVFARMEYSYTDYENNSLQVGGGTESFENSESLFRAAIGIRF